MKDIVKQGSLMFDFELKHYKVNHIRTGLGGAQKSRKGQGTTEN